jgi:glycine cleavage system H protein
MSLPTDLKYTSSHEWLLLDGEHVTVGITDHAQEQLGELVFVELPEVGTEVKQGDDLAVVESVKTASDVYAPVSGEVVAVNDSLDDEPSQVNATPFDNGWLFKLRLTQPSELEQLMSADDYADMIQEG